VGILLRKACSLTNQPRVRPTFWKCLAASGLPNIKLNHSYELMEICCPHMNGRVCIVFNMSYMVKIVKFYHKNHVLSTVNNCFGARYCLMRWHVAFFVSHPPITWQKFSTLHFSKWANEWFSHTQITVNIQLKLGSDWLFLIFNLGHVN